MAAGERMPCKGLSVCAVRLPHGVASASHGAMRAVAAAGCLAPAPISDQLTYHSQHDQQKAEGDEDGTKILRQPDEHMMYPFLSLTAQRFTAVCSNRVASL